MDHIARECSYVTGRTVAHGGAGDSSVLTAYGVFQGMRAAAERIWGAPTLHGRTVGVAGVGKVGRHLVRHLVEDGATVVVTDVDQTAVAAVQAEHPDVRSVADADALVASELDVYAPCALGGALTDEVVGAARPRRSSAAPPTTSSPTRASRSSCRTAGCSTPPTTWSTPVA